MKFSLTLPLALLLALVATTRAFAPLLSQSAHLQRVPPLGPRTDVNENEAVVDYPPSVQPGSHDELMYALGVNLARQLGDVRPLVESGEELASVAKGLLDTVIGRLSEDGQRNILSSRGQDLNQLISGRANELRYRLEEQGRQMLQEMSDREDTYTLDSGVVLHVTQPGREGGARPTRSSTIRVHYHGTLADGTVFDSTLDGEPVTFPLANVIPGWCEGITHMIEGETAMLGIPPEQAYGAEGTPDGRVPGGSTLFFKVELLEVLSAGIGGEPKLMGMDGQELRQDDTGLLGADGRPMYY